MILGIGVDAVDIDRFRKSLERTPSMHQRLFTEHELAYVAPKADPVPSLAARFASQSGDEGDGSRPRRSAYDAWVDHRDSGEPLLHVTGRALISIATRHRPQHLSITHTDLVASPTSLRRDDVTSSACCRSSRQKKWRRSTSRPGAGRDVDRGGTAVAWAALHVGGAYGRTVNVLYGKGNNGADGRVAARHLEAKGVRVRIFDVPSHPPLLPDADLVIDAAYGTGFHGTWNPPDVGDTPVLAVDVPSGVDALTGDITGDVLAATHTVTFAALKPGLLMPPGSALAGVLELADIGLDIGWACEPRAGLGHRRLVAGARRVCAQVAERLASDRRQLDHDGCPAIGCARRHAHRRGDGAPVGPGYDPGRGTDRDRPTIVVEHGLGRCRARFSRPLSRRRRRAGTRPVGRHRGQCSQARARGTAADGARWRRAVRPGLERGGRQCAPAPAVGAHSPDAPRRRVRVVVGKPTGCRSNGRGPTPGGRQRLHRVVEGRGDDHRRPRRRCPGRDGR